MYLELLLVSAIIVWILDLSGVMISIKGAIWKWVWGKKVPYRDFSFKPWECSLCMTHHICLLLLFVLYDFTIYNYAYVCLIAFLTPITKDVLIWVKDTLQTLINLIYRLTTR